MPTTGSRMIAGCEVLFPEGKTPFPAQFAVMSKVISALNKEHHALLESPTGTGKTLALLSSALGWQRKWMQDEQRRVDELNKARYEKWLQQQQTQQETKSKKSGSEGMRVVLEYDESGGGAAANQFEQLRCGVNSRSDDDDGDGNDDGGCWDFDDLMASQHFITTASHKKKKRGTYYIYAQRQ